MVSPISGDASCCLRFLVGDAVPADAGFRKGPKGIQAGDTESGVVAGVVAFCGVAAAPSGRRVMVSDLGEKDLERLFFHKMIGGNQKERLTKMLVASQRMIFQMVPVSFAFYMCDHLCNPKLATVMERCSMQAKTDGERLFYYFLLFKCNPDLGYPKLHDFAKNAPRGLGDLIAGLFLRVYGYETPLSQEEVEKLVALLDAFRLKNITYLSLIR